MQLPTKSRGFHQKTVLIVSEIINALLYCLLVVGVAAIGVGIYLAGEHLFDNFRNHNSGELLETVIIDMIVILAVVEVIRGILSYLDQGRVRVSLIIEVVLIVTLNEIIRGWFEEGNSQNDSLYLIVVAAVLLVMRVLALRFGPQEPSKKQGK